MKNLQSLYFILGTLDMNDNSISKYIHFAEKILLIFMPQLKVYTYRIDSKKLKIEIKLLK